MCFFFEVPRIEESQGPGSSPRRGEVGRRALGANGGFLLPFFYRARFRESTSTTRKRQARKMYPNKTPITSGVEESNSPRRAPLLLLSTFLLRTISGKKTGARARSSRVNKTLTPRIEFSQLSMGGSYRRTPNMGGHLGGGYTHRERPGRDYPTPPTEPLASVFPPQQRGAMGPSGPWANPQRVLGRLQTLGSGPPARGLCRGLWPPHGPPNPI